MISIPSLLTLIHMIGLALAVGGATLKLTLLFKCKAHDAFVPVFLKVTKPITKQIIIGIIFLTLSGIGWLFYGYDLTPLLIVKIMIFAVIWILGPVIDNLIEPKFQALAPATNEQASAAFIHIRKQYLALEIIATSLFYVIIIIWV